MPDYISYVAKALQTPTSSIDDFREFNDWFAWTCVDFVASFSRRIQTTSLFDPFADLFYIGWLWKILMWLLF
jgi:hypothetical protein